MRAPIDTVPRQRIQELDPGLDRDALAARYREVRCLTSLLCAPLQLEDYQVQSLPEASPTKWHLAHTTWFFETFVLVPGLTNYRVFHPGYNFLFNSYYNAVGERLPRARRGHLSRPSVEEIQRYRAHIDAQVQQFLERTSMEALQQLALVLELGLHHEQQHQELLLTDIKHALCTNPLQPAYREISWERVERSAPLRWFPYSEGTYWLGHDGIDFAYDNERPRHRCFLEAFELASRLVTNGEYLAFIDDGGYERPELWLSEGWDTCQGQHWQAPLYWEEHGGYWQVMTLGGLHELNPDEPVCHVSYYEADAFARWAGARLPTEMEWEVAAVDQPLTGNLLESGQLHPRPWPAALDLLTPGQLFGDVWEWTQSPYTPYPGYQPPSGALGEYNGKFMCNQMVLRGGSCVTPSKHIRCSYRNFFPPATRWQFTGIRLTRSA